MGLGLLGRGVGDVRTLASCGAELLVTDLKSKEVLAPSLEKLKEFPNITYVLGEHRLKDFRQCDMVLKAAGVPLDSPYIAEARARGIPIAMSAALFAELSGIPIIGVTGTRGKSTVTHLIHQVLSRAAGEEPRGGSARPWEVFLERSEQKYPQGVQRRYGEKVLLGGNVRGVSNLALLDEIEEGSTAVMELDSWQLQGFGEAHISPGIAIFTNFMDDHLDYYHNDRNQYFADKAQIFLHQVAGDTFVTTPEVFARAQAYAKKHGVTFVQEVILVDESLVPEEWVIPLVGAHNRRNVALARAALKAAGLDDEDIRAGVETFRG
ncbi:MAG: Mur ligase family protein, partial [Patescibacteria group bacterium]|nr:Mur ligase family protein [Patescibacteria group bacterium]